MKLKCSIIMLFNFLYYVKSCKFTRRVYGASASLQKLSKLWYTHTHTYIYMCVCARVCIYIIQIPYLVLLIV